MTLDDIPLTWMPCLGKCCCSGGSRRKLRGWSWSRCLYRTLTLKKECVQYPVYSSLMNPTFKPIMFPLSTDYIILIISINISIYLSIHPSIHPSQSMTFSNIPSWFHDFAVSNGGRRYMHLALLSRQLCLSSDRKSVQTSAPTSVPKVLQFAVRLGGRSRLGAWEKVNYNSSNYRN